MLYTTCIVGIQDQLLGKSLVSIENNIHFITDAQIFIRSYIENHTNNKHIAVQLGSGTNLVTLQLQHVTQ